MASVLKYLSFRGRANRQRYWLTVLSIFGMMFASAIAAVILQVVPLLSVIVVPFWLALIIASFANGARRLHDRNKSAWWLLVFYVLPALLSMPYELAQHGPPDDFQAAAAMLALLGLPFSIWGIVDLGFLKGVAGPNRFGEDPSDQLLEPTIA